MPIKGEKLLKLTMIGPSMDNTDTPTEKNPDQYPVYPEQQGEWDRPINPYSPV